MSQKITATTLDEFVLCVEVITPAILDVILVLYQRGHRFNYTKDKPCKQQFEAWLLDLERRNQLSRNTRWQVEGTFSEAGYLW